MSQNVRPLSPLIFFVEARAALEVINHQFNWWFDYAPIRGLCLQRLEGGCLKHIYRLASKRDYLLVSSLFDSSFCC